MSNAWEDRAVAPPLSVSQITTLNSSYTEDIEAYQAAGFDGIGIWELKLAADGDDAQALEELAASGLAAAAAVPAIPSILPLPLLGGPEDPAERVEAYCRSVERLAPFRPSGLVVLTGSAQGRDPDEARTIVVEGLRTIAGAAQAAGVRIGVEPHQRIGGEAWTIASSIPEAVELIHEAGDPPSLGIQFDVYHLWNTETLYDDIGNEAHRFVGVHVCDRRQPTRGWADRAFPGEGTADVPRILAALDAAGWDGLYDIEVFSDDGTFGTAYPDSIWALPPAESLERARASFERCWSDTPRTTVKEWR
jgi:sugar phosphate isomerase/epimerase